MEAGKGTNTRPSGRRSIDLSALFASHQAELLARLKTVQKVVAHPTTKGDASELDWRGMLSDLLPSRYQVSKGFVIDSAGEISDQIDIVIHDRHYSPLLFKRGEANYVPSESVYAVFEVKATLRGGDIAYAGKKAGSVRRLMRTSVRIPHAGGEFLPKSPFPILAGVVATTVNWKASFDKHLMDALNPLPHDERIELGCIVDRGGFEVSWPPTGEPSVRQSQPGLSVSFFVLRLLSRLQQLGTVPAIDLDRYLAAGGGMKRTNKSP